MNRYDKSPHETVLARARRIPMAVWNWWNELPGKQLTRRGIMELTDDQRSELGLPRQCASASQFRTSDRL